MGHKCFLTSWDATSASIVIGYCRFSKVSNISFSLALWMQQSAAFKILRTRLKTVPSYSFSDDQVERTFSGNTYSQILHHIPSGSQISEDGDVNQDVGTSDSHNGINFTTRLHQFEQKQKQHRVLAKAQAKSRKISTSSSKVCWTSLSHYCCCYEV